jgi:hypothetical protein
MDALESHFKTEFQETDPDVHVDEEWWDGLAKIDDTEKQDLDKPITKGTLGSVLFKDMAEGKSPGSDGLSVKFYKKIWCLLKDPLFECMKLSWEKGELTD